MAITSADWWLTSRCQLACSFCYGPVPGKDPVHLRDEILDGLADSSLVKTVTFCGGEPLLDVHCSEYARVLGRNGKDTILNTNGLLLRRHARMYGLPFSAVGVSIDGYSPRMQQLMRGDKADVIETCRGAELVTELGIPLKMATVVSAVNSKEIPALGWRARALGASVWRLYQYAQRGAYNRGQEQHWMSTEEFLDIVRIAGEWADPVPVAASTEQETEGCLIVTMTGDVITPTATDYAKHGNMLQEPLDGILQRIPAQAAERVAGNKQWQELTV